MATKRGVIAFALGFAAFAVTLAGRSTRRFAVREDSMVPTLEPEDWVVARRRTGSPRRGDIVVFPDPADAHRSLIKRVIGLPGEHIGVDAGRVTVDGALLADRWANGATRPDGHWSIGDDEVWVLGDNRGRSASDGRQVGPTPIGDIEWIVIARYWPARRLGRI